VPCLLGPGGVLAHDVVVHERLAPEEREAAGTAEDAADHVLGGLLQPVADGVLEPLVPHHGAGADRVDAAARRAQLLVLLHQVDQQLHGVRLEVDVAVQRQQVRVLGDHLLALRRDPLLHQPVTQQVVHVHHLQSPTIFQSQSVISGKL